MTGRQSFTVFAQLGHVRSDHLAPDLRGGSLVQRELLRADNGKSRRLTSRLGRRIRLLWLLIMMIVVFVFLMSLMRLLLLVHRSTRAFHIIREQIAVLRMSSEIDAVLGLLAVVASRDTHVVAKIHRQESSDDHVILGVRDALVRRATHALLFAPHDRVDVARLSHALDRQAHSVAERRQRIERVRGGLAHSNVDREGRGRVDLGDLKIRRVEFNAAVGRLSRALIAAGIVRFDIVQNELIAAGLMILREWETASARPSNYGLARGTARRVHLTVELGLRTNCDGLRFGCDLNAQTFLFRLLRRVVVLVRWLRWSTIAYGHLSRASAITVAIRDRARVRARVG